jgi:quercetin dioxygenase-like cupin family protein
MISPATIARLSDPTTAVMDKVCAADVYTLAPGYHVSFLAGGAPDTGTPFDLIEVVAARRGGPAAQRHGGTTCFHVLEGHLEIVEMQADRRLPSIRLSPGATHAVPADVAHIVGNAGEGAVRFLIGGRPGTIASYLAQLDGVRPAQRAYGQAS